MNKVYLVIETLIDGSSKVISAWKDEFDATIELRKLAENGNQLSFYEIKEMNVQ